MEYILFGVGIILGGILIHIIMRYRSAGVKGVFEERINRLQHENESLKEELSVKEDSIIELNRNVAAKTADLDNISEKLNAQKDEIQKIQEKFTLEFKNLANEILEEKTSKFTEVNRSKMEEILKPLSEKIKNFEKRVEETYDKESKERFSLKREVENLAKLNLEVSKEAERLAVALKGESKTQGNWGEMILENILDKSGLVKNREFFVQESMTDESGKKQQPDVLVHLPDNRVVIIDAKVSLTAYEKYVSSNNDDKKKQYIKEHLSSVRNHIRILSGKNYQDLVQQNHLDFVMMFLPVEPAYLVAVQNDPEIWNEAYENKILLISPTNLLAALKMIESLWKQEYQNKNVMEIARQSGALVDKFYALLKDLEKIGMRLKSAQESYDDTVNKLKDGKGNLIGRAEKIKELGAKAKKTLPDEFTGQLDDGEK